MFSDAYKKAPPRAIKSPTTGAMDVYFSPLRCKKSFKNPIEMPKIQIAMEI
jgi:hypothetical protein